MGSHYSQYQSQDVDSYNKKLDKKYSCLVPVGNTSDLIAKEGNTIDDALGFCFAEMKRNTGDVTKPKEDKPAIQTPIDQLIAEFDPKRVEVKPRKHSKGKAEGARFCYLSSIAAASEYAETAADYVGRQLDNLLSHQYEVSQQVTFMMIVEYAALAVGTHKELFDGVIAVRNKALESGKYTQESWKEAIEVELLLDAAARHLISYLYIDEIDEESGENHMCHIVANVIMIAQQLKGEQYGQ